MLEENKIYRAECTALMQQIDDSSVDCILTDPPYLYLKNQKLDRPFDEAAFFSEARRVLKKSGFIVLFGRGTSFYRWNTRLADLGFTFKEEIIWDKGSGTSPLAKFIRKHEAVSISSKGGGIINKVKVPYIEVREGNIPKIQMDINRIISTLNTTDGLEHLKNYVAGKRSDMELDTRFTRHKVTSDIRKSGERGVNTINSIEKGITEKSIIYIYRDHYATIHPTQKPVRLLERLLALVTKEGDLVLDPFAGSGSTAIACANTGRRFIGVEIDEEYHAAGAARVQEVLEKKKLQLF
jgi:site-specific DNA-methyltransferase (adenine-specific)